jgi:hypothetical protein
MVEDVSDHPVIRRGLPAGTRSQDVERVLMVLVANKCDLEFERQIGIDGGCLACFFVERAYVDVAAPMSCRPHTCTCPGQSRPCSRCHVAQTRQDHRTHQGTLSPSPPITLSVSTDPSIAIDTTGPRTPSTPSPPPAAHPIHVHASSPYSPPPQDSPNTPLPQLAFIIPIHRCSNSSTLARYTARTQ